MDNVNWSSFIAYYKINKHDVAITEDGLLLKPIAFTLQTEADAFMLEGFNYAKKLYENGAQFSRMGIELIIKLDHLSFIVQTAEDLFILEEIYVNLCYPIPNSSEAIVLDIGFNVGFASLYFAQHPFVTNVYSYEPMTPTYKQGLRNLALNHSTSEKIETHNFGLSKACKVIEVAYSYEVKGQVTTSHPQHLYSHLDYKNETATLKDAAEIVEEIIKAHPGVPLIAKLDCEGSEYEILTRWSEANQLSRFSAIMLEYHNNDHKPLTALLRPANFEVETNSINDSRGMIYAKTLQSD